MAKAKSQTVKTTNTTTKTKTVKYHQKKGSVNSNKCPHLRKIYEKGVSVFDRTYKNEKKAC